MTDRAPSGAVPPRDTWIHPPDGTYLPRIALVNWTIVHSPKLTVSPDAARLEGYCREPLGAQPASGYECVAEAVGWRWRFRGTVETVVGPQSEWSMPVVVTSISVVIAEPAPSAMALQAQHSS